MEEKNILVLFPFYETRDWDYDFKSGFFSIIEAYNVPNLKILLEYLNTDLIPEITTVKETLHYLGKIETVHNPDLIVSVFPSVHSLMLKHGETIFPGVPKIFVPIIGPQLEEMDLLPNAYSIRSEVDYALESNLKNMKQILPDLEQLIVICGGTEDDIYYLKLFKSIAQKVKPDYTLKYLVDLPVSELHSRLSELPDNTAIFYLPINQDRENTAFNFQNLFPTLSNIADAPIFSFNESPFGRGIVGGTMTTAFSYGENTAKMILEILFEHSIEPSFNFTIIKENYDWRQLQRWGIDEEHLPEGSEIFFKTETFTEKYLVQILLITFIILIETALLIILFFNLRKRRTTEKLLERSQNTARLGGWDIDIKTNKFFYTDEILNLLELAPSVVLTMEKIISFSHPDDIDSLKKALNQTIRDGKGCKIEQRIITSNANEIWVRMQCDSDKKNGQVIKISGTMQDITDRKIAEMKLLNSLNEKDILLKEVHHRVKNNLAIITSLLSLQQDSVSDEYVKALLLSSQNRILSMAIIHEQLYKENNLNSLDFAGYAHELLNSIMSSYSGKVDTVSTEMKIIKQELELDILVPIGIILNEIISNSLEHAFKEVKNPCIEISLEKLEEDLLVLSLRDNGIGLPDDDYLKRKTTIGFLLINNLVSQIGGRLEINRKKGTECRIYFNPNL